MKFFIDRIKKITIASIVTMVIYISTYWLSSALMNEFAPSYYLASMCIYCLIFIVGFSFFLIYFSYIKNDMGPQIALKDFADGYCGIVNDYKLLFKREINLLYSFAFINGVRWLIECIDQLVFSKNTLSGIFLIYAPLNIIGLILPAWFYSILSYILGPVICFAIYLLELVVFRKKWYRYWNKKEGMKAG